MTERVEIHHIKHIAGFSDKGEIYSRTMPVEWVGLTDEEISSVAYNTNPLDGIRAFARAIEAKLMEKNHYA